MKYNCFGLVIEPLFNMSHLTSVSQIDPTSTSAIFSTTATILTTIFTIIFVLLTVFIQMSDVITTADIFQSKEINSLMLLYFFTIILSLVMLVTTIKFPIFVLTMTFICILLLYPFLHNLKYNLIYKIGMPKSIEETSLLINSKNEFLLSGKVHSFYEIGYRTIKDDKLEYFSKIMSICENIAETAEKQGMANIVREIGTEYLYSQSKSWYTNKIKSL